MESARGGGSRNYDVFISFRGPDTRHGFVDCLYEHMSLAGIRVFVDNERLHVGDVIGEELMRSIDDSKICMPVFSRSYASSKWCLLELERIMMDRGGQEVLPVFYNVSPDDVKLQTRLYMDDLEALEKEHGIDMVDRWRKCLKEVCKIKGWNPEESQGQGKLIKEIVQEVLYKTKKRYKNVSDHFVRIDDQVKEMMDLLDDRIDCVRVVIIHGMGGIGKTTLAKVIFNDVSLKFQGCSFISNVRESSYGNGIVKLQQQLLNDTIGTLVSIYDVDDGINEIRERCCNKKVLLILDDVDDREQIRKLAGMFDWFGRGSRIIITTRDYNVIPIELLQYNAQRKNKKRKMEAEDDLGDICHYEMREMDHQHATTLFKRHAFSVDENSFDDVNLLQEIVLSTGGLPLALEVVGSYLFGQSKAVWRETLRKLKRAPHKKVQSALMISYESLEDDEKEIFLDIACFFSGIEKRLPMYMWESLDLCPESGTNALRHKSLIKIVDGGRIWMHDQLRDFGREIVRRDGKSSRIWKHEEAFRMISDRKGTNDVILLDLGDLSESCKFKKAEFKELTNLRGLRLSGGNLEGDFSNCFPQLRWLEWNSFPSNFQAQNFSPPNLAVLRLAKTDIDDRWTGWNRLLGSKLKFLELSGCRGLTRTPDFSGSLGLEMLVLQHCNRLTEIDNSIGKLQQLVHLEVRGSPNLKGLPSSLESLKIIEKLIVIGIARGESLLRFHLPLQFDNLKSLCHLAIEGVGLESLPKGIGQLKQLEYLSFARCSQLTSLPESVWELESLMELNLMRTGLTGFSGCCPCIGCLTKLEELDVSFCLFLDQIPSEIGNLFSLRVLTLRGASIIELPSTVSQLSCLQHLDLFSCSKLRKVKQLPASLSHLNFPCFSLLAVPDFSNLVNLVELKISSNKASSFPSVGFLKMDGEEVEGNWQTTIRSPNFLLMKCLHLLKGFLRVVPSDAFKSIQVDFQSLSLAMMKLSCSDAESLSQITPNLFVLLLTKLMDTTLKFSPYPNLKNLSALFIHNSSSEEIELRGIELMVNLLTIYVSGCQSLTSVRLAISSCPRNLNSFVIMGCPKLVEVGGVDRLESVQTLWFYTCPSLSRLPDLSNLMKMKNLMLHHCISMDKIPALPSKDHPFDLEVIDCGKLPDFVGPHHLYVEETIPNFVVPQMTQHLFWILELEKARSFKLAKANRYRKTFFFKIKNRLGEDFLRALDFQ